MSLKDDLIASRARFTDCRANSIEAAFRGACSTSPTALSSLVLLRESLPTPFEDFREFETSRSWSRREAFRVFDRAIAKAGA